MQSWQGAESSQKNYIFVHISLTLEMILGIIFSDDIFMAKMPECYSSLKHVTGWIILPYEYRMWTFISSQI